MASSFVDGVSQTNILNLAQSQKSQGTKYEATATPELAQSIGMLYAANPWLSAGQVLALAKGQASPQAVELASSAQGKVLQTELDPTNKQSKGWFERNVYGKAKNAARWSFAALQFAPDLAQNVASQAFSPNDEEGFDGWFKSTELGTMVADSKDSGSGWFLGGEAKEKQGARAREVRGTINGHAWTVGRGAASLVFVPGSREYGILSGFLDAAVTVAADPTVWGGKIVKGVRTAQAIIPGLKTAEEIALANKVAARGLAGLSDVEQVAWNANKYMGFARSDGRMVRLAERIAAEDDPVAILLDAFDGNMDLTAVKQFKEAKTVDQVFAILGQQTVHLDEAASKFLPDDVRKIPGALRRTWIKERAPVQVLRNSKLFTEMPSSLVVHGTSADRMKAVKNYSNYLNTNVGNYAKTDKGKALLNKVFTAYENGSEEGMKLADEAFDATVAVLLKSEGLSDGVIREVFAKVAQVLDETKVYWRNEAGHPEDGGFVQSMFAGGQLDRKEYMGSVKTSAAEFDAGLGFEFKAAFSPEQIDSLRMSGPGSISELLDRVHVLPDVRVIRRLTSNPFVRKALSKADGDPRAAIATVEYLQNKIWKPLTLATGGYIFRNMADAQVRIATVGKAGILNHPIRYLQYVTHQKSPETILGQAFQDTLKYTNQAQVDNLINAGRAAERRLLKGEKTLSKANLKELKNDVKKGKKASKYMEGADARRASFDEGVDVWAENQMHGMSRNLSDPVQAQLGAYRRGSMQRVNKVAERDLYLKGYVDEISRMATDPIEAMVAKGIPSDLAIEWLRQTPKGQRGLAQLEKYLENYPMVDKNGITTRGSIKNVDDTVLTEWANKFGEGRVGVRTGGDEDLRFVIAHRRIPLKTSEVVDPRDYDGPGAINVLRGGPLTKGKGTTISLHREGEDLLGVVTDVIDTPDGVRWRVQHVSPYDIVEDHRGKEQLRELLETKIDAVKSDGSALLPEESMLPSLISKNKDAEDNFMNWFFSNVYGKATQKFEKSPVFRQYYYDHIAKNADSLSGEEAQKLLKQIEARAAANKMKPEDFVGNKKVWNAILDAEKHAALTPGTINPAPGQGFFWATDEARNAFDYAVNKNPLGNRPGAVHVIKVRKNTVSSAGAHEYNVLGNVVPLKSFGPIPHEPRLGVRHEVTGPADDYIRSLKADLVATGQSDEWAILAHGGPMNLTPAANANGTGTYKQLDDYAQLRALDESKQLLYDASNRNNLEDIMRVLIPFGVAYREVLGTYAKFIIEDPTRIRRAQLMFTGLTNADPDNDGQGFFYKDPTSGQYSFNFPFSAELSKLLTGTTSPLQGQVKRLSMGLSVLPSLGPIGQIAASELIPNTPKYDAIVSVLFPYGRGMTSPAPGWARKMYSAFRDNPGKLETVYGNTYVDTLRALSTSGDYDLSTEEGKTALMSDAKEKARWLTGLRALGQFIGPTSAAIEFEITTKNGDMYASQLVKEFYALQNDNYQTAVSEFLRIYGDDAILYLSSKTKAVDGGLGASAVFGDWEREHGDLFNRYPKVAGYFAPGGDDFSFTTWNHQVQTGKRVRLSDTEIIEQAQYRIGAAQYRAYRVQVGSYPTGEQREWLIGVRTALSERYPGFPAVAVFEVGGHEQMILQLRQAVQHKDLSDNPVASAVATYLGYRDTVIAQYVAQGGSAQGLDSAKGAEALRDYLSSIGEALVAQTPEFGRIWERELSGEVTS